MTFTEARDLLSYYNKWRRDDNVPNSYEMPNPTVVGKAIDIAIDALNSCISSGWESYTDVANNYRELNELKSKSDRFDDYIWR